MEEKYICPEEDKVISKIICDYYTNIIQNEVVDGEKGIYKLECKKEHMYDLIKNIHTIQTSLSCDSGVKTYMILSVSKVLPSKFCILTQEDTIINYNMEYLEKIINEFNLSILIISYNKINCKGGLYIKNPIYLNNYLLEWQSGIRDIILNSNRTLKYPKSQENKVLGLKKTSVFWFTIEEKINLDFLIKYLEEMFEESLLTFEEEEIKYMIFFNSKYTKSYCINFLNDLENKNTFSKVMFILGETEQHRNRFCFDVFILSDKEPDQKFDYKKYKF